MEDLQPHDVPKRSFFRHREERQESKFKKRLGIVLIGLSSVALTAASVDHWVDSKIEKSGDAIDEAKEDFSDIIEDELYPELDKKLAEAKDGFSEEMKTIIDNFFQENFGIEPKEDEPES